MASCMKMNNMNNKAHCVGFVEYLKRQQFTTKSINSRIRVFEQYLEWLNKENLEAQEITYNDLLLYIKYRNRKGATQRTIQHYLGTIRHFYDHLLESEEVEKNPARNIEIKGVKRKSLYLQLDTHELHKIYNQYPADTPTNQRDKVMLGLIINQGIKSDEIAKMEVKDVNLREGKINVPGSRKSEGREMKLEAHQVMDMFNYVMTTRDEILQMPPKRKSQVQNKTDKLFIAQAGNTSSFSNWITQMMLKVRKINPSVQNAKHIRSSVITKWLKVHNLRQVQYLAGHRYISSTESYLENDVDKLMDEVNQYHPLG
jgi:integrase/recombinase XerD